MMSSFLLDILNRDVCVSKKYLRAKKYKRNQLKSSELTISNSRKVHRIRDEDQVRTGVAVQMICDTTGLHPISCLHHQRHANFNLVVPFGWHNKVTLGWHTWMTERNHQFREQIFEHPLLNKGLDSRASMLISLAFRLPVLLYLPLTVWPFAPTCRQLREQSAEYGAPAKALQV